MKHIFFIHSHITFIVSIMTKKHLNLNDENCVFLIHRGDINDYGGNNIIKIVFPFNNPQESFPLYIKFWKSWRRLKDLDNFLDEITLNNDFIFYTPQTFQNFLALIISHKSCKGFNIIEEGTGSYLNDFQLNNIIKKNKFSLLKRLRWKLNYFSRLEINRPFISDKYINAYNLTPFSFPGKNRKVVLGLPSIQNDIFREFDNQEVTYKNILVFDALVEANLIGSDVLLLSTLILINKLVKNGETTLHVKFHPSQILFNKNLILLKELFNQIESINIIEIPPKVSLELVAIKYNVNFYVYISSIGIYASMFGRKVYSLCSIIEKLSPTFSNTIENIPAIFKENVEFITYMDDSTK